MAKSISIIQQQQCSYVFVDQRKQTNTDEEYYKWKTENRKPKNKKKRQNQKFINLKLIINRQL